MSSSSLNIVKAAARANGLSQITSTSEPWHWQVDDLITRDAHGHGDARFKAQIQENQASAALWNAFGSAFPSLFESVSADVSNSPSKPSQPLQPLTVTHFYSPGSGALDPTAFSGALIDGV